MSILPFFVVSEAAAVGALLFRGSHWTSAAIGLGGLVVAIVAAVAITPGEHLTAGGAILATTAFQRLFLVLGSVGGLGLCLVGRGAAAGRDLPAAILASLGWLGLALALAEPTAAIAAAACAGMAGVLVTVAPMRTGRGSDVAARELRSTTVAAGIVIVGVVVAGAAALRGDGATGGVDPVLLGIAYLGIVLALALRLGAVPFQAWAGRASTAAPLAALPLILAWVPAGFAMVVLGWIHGSVAPLAGPLGVERGVVVAIGVLTLVVGTFAVWIQDDLEHVVAYSIAQDAGFIVLGLAVLDPAGWGPVRTWVLVFVASKAALAAWAVAVEARHDTRRIDHLDGWARRSPLLGATFVAIVLATIGWPGSAAWDARWELAGLAAGDSLRWVIILGAGGSLGYYARLATIGLRRPAGSAGDAAASAGLVRWGALRRAPTAEPPSALETADARTDRPAGRSVAVVARWASATGRVDRRRLAGIVVAALAALAILVAAGGLGVTGAAREAPVQASAGVHPSGASAQRSISRG